MISFDITTPAACIDACLFRPSSFRAILKSFLILGFLFASSVSFGSSSIYS